MSICRNCTAELPLELGADLRSHTDEHGAFSEEELAEARARIFGTTQAAGGTSAA
ncbi:hypothetical protein [Streptomyces sp. NPDC047042]|uniref:hypothetical protein n=1 Tax=Streptomyces sp. NPDC047042 TaxID=3154807 RepID=UPI0033EB289D